MATLFNTKILDIPILDLHDAPTVRDVDLGVRLGMKTPLGIRRTIRRHIQELQGYGRLHTVRAPSATAATTTAAAIGDDTEYHLTEPQALCLCQLSRAPQAAAVRRMLTAAFRDRRRHQERMMLYPDDIDDVIIGPCSFPYLRPGNTGLDWQGHLIDTDLSRLHEFEDVVALLPDGSVDIVRLAGPTCGAGGRQGICRRHLDPDSAETTPVMVTILGQIVDDADRWPYERRSRAPRTGRAQRSAGTGRRQRIATPAGR